MSVAPQDRNLRRRRWWSCPRCFEVVPGLAWVDYGMGVGIVQPQLTCVSCLMELRERERLGSLDPGTVIWGIRVLEVVGVVDLAMA